MKESRFKMNETKNHDVRRLITFQLLFFNHYVISDDSKAVVTNRYMCLESQGEIHIHRTYSIRDKYIQDS